MLLLVGFLTYLPAAAVKAETRILALGDSLTAGYGLPKTESFTYVLEQELRASGYDVRVLNAGVSGDTSAGGLSRLDWALSELDGASQTGVILELGANDGLRGFNPRITEDNLRQIITRIQEMGHPVLFTGMYALPNFGKAYGEAFNGLFPKLAEEMDVIFYPFFLEGVAAIPELNQDDAIHPNAKGTRVIVRNILPYVKRLLDSP